MLWFSFLISQRLEKKKINTQLRHIYKYFSVRDYVFASKRVGDPKIEKYVANRDLHVGVQLHGPGVLYDEDTFDTDLKVGKSPFPFLMCNHILCVFM